MDAITRPLKRPSSHCDCKEVCSHVDSGEHYSHSKIQKTSFTTSPTQQKMSRLRNGRTSRAYESDAMDVDEPEVGTSRNAEVAIAPQVVANNGHLKGRKRFTADLKDLQEEAPFMAYGLLLKSIKPGDEEGSIELTIHKDGETFISLNLLIDESSLYPKDHSFYAFALDGDTPPHLLEVVENVATSSTKPLYATIRSLMASFSASSAAGAFVPPGEAYTEHHSEPPSQEDGSESEDGANDYYDIDDEIGLETVLPVSKTNFFEALKNHFLEIIASDYKPGVTRMSENEFVLSVSCPVPSLSIPPQALVAWDRRLLETYNNFTLLISGVHGAYPFLDSNGALIPGQGQPKFHVGLSPRYKPSKEVILQTIRNFSIVSMSRFALDPETEQSLARSAAQQIANDPGRFETFSLSASLEGALEDLLPIVQLRFKYKLGWAGAETLYTAVKQTQKGDDELIIAYAQAISAADKEENRLRKTNSLPPDPFDQPITGGLNLPFLAYCYLLRRFMLCPRYCLVCHRKMKTSFEALKPYVCDDKLCTYQYYALNFGPSIEYEIRTNPQVVDLLVSLAYVGAYDHQISENLPVGLGLRVKPPNPLPSYTYKGLFQQPQKIACVTTPAQYPSVGPDGCVEFDLLSLELQRAAIVQLIDQLPPIAKMKAHLEKKVQGKVAPQLRTLDENTSPAAWSILRWCVASSTAHIEAITEHDDQVCHIGGQWQQFRFSVGAPDKEQRYLSALKEIQTQDRNAKKYPALYAFHGSALKNWHSIIRQGLLIKNAVHGRAFGHGVYFSRDASLSMHSYAQGSTTRWAHSELSPIACVALAQIINSPNQFTSQNPYYVVQHVDWILCRYLLVKKEIIDEEGSPLPPEDVEEHPEAQYLTLDPKQTLTMGHKNILIPEQSQKLEKLLLERIADKPLDEPFDEQDQLVLSEKFSESSQSKPTSFLASSPLTSLQQSRINFSLPSKVTRKAQDDWSHIEAWCNEETFQLLPPPTDSSPQAILSLQRELRAMLKEQETAIKNNVLNELGWFFPPKLMGDNLFRWMVELHSFDPSLPIAKDMAKQNVPSLLFEIRFPDRFPIQPPFFRIVKPRFLPFSQGGGGHVTIGGSICMDLLTADGWLPSYSIAAVLLQIKLAISNMEPKPARLSTDWDRPYALYEAIDAFKRVANVHGWRVPQGLEKLIL